MFKVLFYYVLESEGRHKRVDDDVHPKVLSFKIQIQIKGDIRENRKGRSVLDVRGRGLLSWWLPSYVMAFLIQHIASFINFMCLITFYEKHFFFGYITRKKKFILDGSSVRQDFKRML